MTTTTSIVPTGTLLDAVAEKLNDLTLDLRPIVWGGGGAALTIGKPDEYGSRVELTLTRDSARRSYGRPKITAVSLKATDVHKRWTKLDAEKIATEARRVYAERLVAVADGHAMTVARVARGRRETAAGAWVRTAVDVINAPLTAKGWGKRLHDHDWAVTEHEDLSTGTRSYRYKLELSNLSEDEMRAILAVLTPVTP